MCVHVLLIFVFLLCMYAQVHLKKTFEYGKKK